MKLAVKTLKGEKFEVEVEESQTVAQVKGTIESSRADLPAANLKLIHSGKILKDDDSIASCGIKPTDFVVVMVTKAKKPEPANGATPAAAPTPASASSAPSSTPAASTPTTPAPASTTAPPLAPPAPSRPSEDDFPADAVNNLMAMGFPEAEVRHCLRAAHGNPDVAVEFLTNGIPDGVAETAALMGSGSATPAASSGGQPLQALRNHPQFNALRRLVQSNPQMLQQVLTQIGQQQPDLLQEINANQALFLEMMNEPVSDEAPSSTSSAPTSSSTSSNRGGGALPFGMEGVGNAAQMAQMIQNLGPEELTQMAAMMGLSPEQLRTTAQMIGSMPPEQLNQFMMQAMSGAGQEGLGGFMGGGGGGGMGGPQVLRLTEEEMAAVDRLTEMGFDRAEAAQAFLACDKNEALAANLLMDSMGEGGGFFGGGSNNDNNQDGNNNGDEGDPDDGDDMYD